MSDQDYSQEEVESREVEEISEGTEERSLEQATSEPEAHVETTRDYQEAEEIEAIVVDLVDEDAVEITEESAQLASSAIEAAEETLSIDRVENREISQTEEKTADESRESELDQTMREAETSTNDDEEERAGAFTQAEVIDTVADAQDEPVIIADVVTNLDAGEDVSESAGEFVQAEVIDAVADAQDEAETIAEVNTSPEAGLETISTLEGDTVAEVKFQETAQLGEEGLLEQDKIPKEALEGVEEYWEPPEMYAHVDKEGKVTLVDANGKPLSSPPVLIQDGVDPAGVTDHYYTASYPSDGNAPEFEIQLYSAPLNDVYVHLDQSGKTTLVDASGKPLDSPPQLIQDGIDSAGRVDHYYTAKYPTADASGTEVELKLYSAPLNDCYVHLDQSGKATLVDASGKPIESPPQLIQDGIDSAGRVDHYYTAKYPTADASGTEVELKLYSAPLNDCYVHLDQSGKATVVDADGVPLQSQPIVTGGADMDGTPNKIYMAYYPNASGTTTKVQLDLYKPPSAA